MFQRFVDGVSHAVRIVAGQEQGELRHRPPTFGEQSERRFLAGPSVAPAAPATVAGPPVSTGRRVDSTPVGCFRFCTTFFSFRRHSFQYILPNNAFIYTQITDQTSEGERRDKGGVDANGLFQGDGFPKVAEIAQSTVRRLASVRGGTQERADRTMGGAGVAR